MHGESDVQRAIRAKRHSRRTERAVQTLAEWQEGVLSREQLAAIGLTRGEIEARVRASHLILVHRCVFAVGYRPLTTKGRWWAALLATGDDGVLSHRSAAEAWELVPELREEVHVTVGGIQRRRHRGVRPHRNRLDQGDVTRRQGLRITTPLRTIIDLAATNPNLIERALRQAEYLRLTDAATLAAAVDTLEGRRGVGALRKAVIDVTEAPGITRSALEQRFLSFLRTRSLPRPKLNVELQIGDLHIEADCIWREQRVIVELDGRDAHMTTAAFERDRARDAALQAVGFAVVRVTWRRLRDDKTRLAAELATLLAHRE